MNYRSIEVIPSLLSADFSRLGEEIRSVEEGGAKILHLDVMDGTFVPNLTFGPILVKAIRKLSDRTLDVHLMVREPAHLIPAFRRAGSDWISIHVEACGDIPGTLAVIRDSGALPGLVLNPETPLERAIPYMGEINHLLLMTVSPGFGGQSFRSEVLPKISEARRIRDTAGHRCLIEVDGGVSPDTAKIVGEAGAELLVAGSAVFGSVDRGEAIAEITRLAAG